PTSVTNKRAKLSNETEVDHEYVMEALRQKVQRNQENPAKKFMTVLKPRSSTPVPSPVDSSPLVHSPIPPQLPPMNVHSPSMNQEQVAKT
ncbi:6116_t:CDS:2, partial [Funneliformis caledonium]